MNKIIICSSRRFPNGEAGAIHLIGIAECFRMIGYDVIFVCKSYCNKNNYNFPFTFFPVNYNNENKLNKIYSHLFTKKRILRTVCKKFKNPDIILFDASFSPNELDFISKKYKNTKLLLSLVEQYSNEEFTNKNLIAYRLKRNNDRLLFSFDNRKFKIITISNYLNNLLTSRKFKCLTIPFLYTNYFDPVQMTTPNKKVTFIYCGSPSKKDSLLMMLEGFTLLPENILNKISIEIVGVERDWIIKKGENSLSKKIFDFTHFYGKLNHEQCILKIKNSDFSILLRNPNAVFSKAGFPTKVSESLHFSTIPITNITSDLGHYLKDGYNSVIVSDYSPESFKEAILRAVSLKNLESIKANCKETSKNFLTPNAFKEKLNNFLKS